MAEEIKPKPRKPRKPRTRKKKTITAQIEETNALPVESEPATSGFGKSVLVGTAMLAGLTVGAHTLPQYVDTSKLSFVQAPETPQKAVEAKTDDPAPVPAPEPKPEPVASVGGIYQDVVIFKIGDKEEVRTGGSVSWRYNNPGLIYYGDFAKEAGAIGTDGRYALFRTYEDGRKALMTLLWESDRGYKNKSLEEAMRAYAPKNEGFNTEYYIKVIKADTGISLSKKMSDFSDKDKNTLLSTLEKIERFKPGKVEVK